MKAKPDSRATNTQAARFPKSLCGMKRSINLSLSPGGSTSLILAITPLLPAAAQIAGTAEDLGGVMSISLKVVVKPTIGFQGALHGAGTPNQSGIGGFLPLSVGENSDWFLDALLNVNFADRDGESSIINSDVDGGFSPRFQEKCHPSRQYTRGLEEMINAALQRGRQG